MNLTEPYVASDGKVFPVGTPIDTVDMYETQLSRKSAPKPIVTGVIAQAPTAATVMQPALPANSPIPQTEIGQAERIAVLEEVVAAQNMFLAQLIKTLTESGSLTEVRAGLDKFVPLAAISATASPTNPQKTLTDFKARLPQVYAKLGG